MFRRFCLTSIARNWLVKCVAVCLILFYIHFIGIFDRERNFRKSRIWVSRTATKTTDKNFATLSNKGVCWDLSKLSARRERAAKDGRGLEGTNASEWRHRRSNEVGYLCSCRGSYYYIWEVLHISYIYIYCMRGKEPIDVFLTENKTLTPEGCHTYGVTDTSSVNGNNRGAGSLTTNG